MRSKRVISVMSIATVLLMLLAAFAAMPGAADVDETVIVLFDDEVDEGFIEDMGGEIEVEWTLIPGALVSIKSSLVKDLGKGSDVRSVSSDTQVSILGKPGSPPGQDKKPKPEPPAEVTPWGVDRIDADLVWTTEDGTGVKVAIMDTGIDLDHPDLDVHGGINFVLTRGRRVNPDAYDDDHGHGTHCAGIAAGLDNTEGIIGAAPGADLYAVKVLNKNGGGSYANIISGIEWCVDNGMDVVSMSFGGGYNSALEAACDAAESAGVLLVAAAGNHDEGEDETVMYPAAYSSVMAISATDINDAYADFSNHGDEVEVAAPGVAIYSTMKGETYETWDGTSMACPHVSGTAALLIAKGLSASEARSVLTSTAEDLGDEGWDEYFGYGLVDAAAAYAAA